jgi:hypothetical protein
VKPKPINSPLILANLQLGRLNQSWLPGQRGTRHSARNLEQQIKWQRVRKFMLKYMQGTMETAGLSRDRSESFLEIGYGVLCRRFDLRAVSICARVGGSINCQAGAIS